MNGWINHARRKKGGMTESTKFWLIERESKDWMNGWINHARRKKGGMTELTKFWLIERESKDWMNGWINHARRKKRRNEILHVWGMKVKLNKKKW